MTRLGRARGQTCSSIQVLSEVKDKNRCYQPSILLLLLERHRGKLRLSVGVWSC